ncbi:MFS transporter [Alkalilimnicola ehrlichii]|nr:MFS transporter [Alkalilimnicola ehrlichii]
MLVIMTIPLIGILALLVWRVQMMGYISQTGAIICYVLIGAAVLYQIVQALRVNIPILKKGVPEDDKYPFKSVVALNSTYFANFGAELAVVSMLPMFFEETWGLTAAVAGAIAASFAFVNLVARPAGGLVSDRMGNRRFVMLSYMFGIGVGFLFMAMLNESWPLIVAIAITITCSVFVQGSEGATFGIIPSIKRRLTGQISGMAGAYGNVGAVFYLTLFLFVTPTQFFLIIAAGAFVSWLICYLWLAEPEGAFDEDYYLSSVDREIAASETATSEVALSSANRETAVEESTGGREAR